MRECWILSMSCVSGDDVQVRIWLRRDVLSWLKILDHEGSIWDVVHHVPSSDNDFDTTDITQEVMEEYRSRSL
jgi:hypothetical protein